MVGEGLRLWKWQIHKQLDLHRNHHSWSCYQIYSNVSHNSYFLNGANITSANINSTVNDISSWQKHLHDSATCFTSSKTFSLNHWLNILHFIGDLKEKMLLLIASLSIDSFFGFNLDWLGFIMINIYFFLCPCPDFSPQCHLEKYDYFKIYKLWSCGPGPCDCCCSRHL